MKLPLRVNRVFGLAVLLAPWLSAWAASDVQVLLDGAPAAVGNYDFPFPAGHSGLTLDNGLVRFTFNRDDAAGGIVTGWDGSASNRPATTSITATSIIINGTELAHHLNGVDPRDPDRQHSFYIDSGGGTARLVCKKVQILRATPDLVEVAFIDLTSAPLRHEHHLIMRRGKRGLYGYDILSATARTSISEVRMNPRLDRSIFDHAFNWERGDGQQPTYAYAATQKSLQDETWRVDGVNNPNLPSPDSNSGNLPADSAYTKYMWSLYHHENPMFGHYGHGFGVWFTPLGGITDQTLAAYYGVGPNHQDLAIHQDALILNYFGPNHYGLPSYSLSSGFRRLYGPWFTYFTVGDAGDSTGLIASAAAIAQDEISENRSGSDWINDSLYPLPAQRTTVTGHLDIADGRPAEGFWALLSTQDVTEVFTIHEPTYFVKTDANGNFTIPGVPPPWAAGTTNPSSYVLYLFAGKGSVTDQYKQTNITFEGATKDLGTITWAPTNHTTFLWQIGKADRMGGEFALATNPTDWTNPRQYDKPASIPGNLTWMVGQSWEPQDWYYAQTNAGVWTISFNLDRAYTGTVYFTVSSSMQYSGTPTLAVNGSGAGLTGALPSGSELDGNGIGATLGRQADRSGRPRSATISFPASRLVTGLNTITLTKATGGLPGTGLGWDTLLLEADETVAPSAAQLTARLESAVTVGSKPTWTLHVDNRGAGAANDARLDTLALTHGSGGTSVPVLIGRDPKRFAVPLGNIPAGGSIDYPIDLDFSKTPTTTNYAATLSVSANGGRVEASATAIDLQANSIVIQSGGYSLNRRTGHVVQQLTLQNLGSSSLIGPIYVVLDNFSSQASLVNGTGVQGSNGSPYIMLGNSELLPGASATVSLEFSNPPSGGIIYTPRVVGGGSMP